VSIANLYQSNTATLNKRYALSSLSSLIDLC